MDATTVDGVMGANWHAFFDKSFGPQLAANRQHRRAAE
jgi:hypothetical protein